MEQRAEKARSGQNMLAVMAALEKAGATDAGRAVTARKLATLDEKLEALGTNGVSNTMSYLNLHRHVLGRNWEGSQYAYWIMRPLSSVKVPAEHRPPRAEPARRKPTRENFKVRIDGPGMVVEREVDGELAARIAAILLQVKS